VGEHLHSYFKPTGKPVYSQLKRTPYILPEKLHGYLIYFHYPLAALNKVCGYFVFYFQACVVIVLGVKASGKSGGDNVAEVCIPKSEFATVWGKGMRLICIKTALNYF
jgi:hypothetical protein